MRDEDRDWAIAHYGDVESRLAEIMARAARRWRQPLSRQDIAATTGLDVKTVGWLERDVVRGYSYKTIATLCWYFDCQPVDLLEYRPPATVKPPPILAPQIGRMVPPTEPPPDGMQLLNRIPQQLGGYSIEAIMRSMDIHRAGALHLTKPGAQRIYRYMLARLCWFLRCSIGDLLLYQP